MAESNSIHLFHLKQANHQKIFDSDLGYNFSCVASDQNNTLYIGDRPDLFALHYERINGEYSSTLQNSTDFLAFAANRREEWASSPLSIKLDREGKLWVSTNLEDIYVLDNAQHFKHTKAYTLSHFTGIDERYRLGHIAPNLSSGTWVSSFDRGVFRFSSKPNPFHQITREKQMPHGLQTNNIRAIIPINNDGGLVLTYYSKPCYLNTQTHTFEPFPFDAQAQNGEYFGNGYQAK